MNALLQPDPLWVRAARWSRRSVVLTAAIMIGLGLFLAWKEGYFTPVAHFYFEARSSKSLSRGMAVKLSGFKIGQVSSVELQSDRSVRVELAIFRHYLEFIKTDSEVRLEAGLPIGDQLGTVIEQIKPIMENISALLSQARQPQGELQVALRNLNDTTARVQAWMPGFLERSDATLAAFKHTGELGTTAIEPFTKADGDLQTSLRDLRATSAELRATIPPVLEDLKALTASLRASAASLEPSVHQVAPQIPALVEEGRRTAASAGEVVDAVKDMSLIKGRINQPVPQPLLPTSQP
jgi:phospholipid/cholesterol/gamma-HCH transport system substrate-binding protein